MTDKHRGIIAGTKFEIIRRITHQQIKLETGITYYLRLDSAIYLGKGDVRPNAKTDETGQPQQPPHLINVTDCETGEVGVIVAPSILVSELEDSFPDSAHIGHAFALTILGKKAGKRYNTIDLVEIVVPAAFLAPDSLDDDNVHDQTIDEHPTAPKKSKKPV